MIDLADLPPVLSINSDRLWRTLMELAQIGATAKGGVSRLALTDLDRQARDRVVAWAREAGCSVRIDAIGNVFVPNRRRRRACTTPCWKR